MKKIIIAFLALFITLSFTADSKAMEYMAGAKGGYYAWQPFLKDIGASGMSDIEWGTGALYGPIVSLIFTPNISFSVAGLMGEQSTHWQSTFSDFNNDTKVTGTYYFEAFRADIDSALSYRLTENFKIFAGYKYQYLKMTYRYTEIRTDTTTGNVKEINVMLMDNNKIPLHGPALGLGVSLPLGMKYFLAANLSGIYLQGKSESKSKRYKSVGIATPLALDSNESSNNKMRQIGVNFEPAVGFSAGEGLPIITLGFRYQHFWVKFPDATGDPLPKKTLHDTLIGGFVSAVFMF